MDPIDIRKGLPESEELEGRVSDYGKLAKAILEAPRPLDKIWIHRATVLRKSLEKEYHQYSLAKNQSMRTAPGDLYAYYRFVQNSVQYTAGVLTSQKAKSFASDVISAANGWNAKLYRANGF